MEEKTIAQEIRETKDSSDLVTAYYRMESLELWAKITINAVILGGSYDISRENIDKLIALREYYGVTGRHPGYKKFENGNGITVG